MSNLNLSVPTIEAYQKVFLFYVRFVILGVIVGLGLVDRNEDFCLNGSVAYRLLH